MPHRKRQKRIRPSAEIKVEFLIPIVQDSTKREHPHTAYAEWNRLLFLNEIDQPTRASGRHRGSEGWGKAAEYSVHWWVVIPKRKLQTLLRLLLDEARPIFDQRWILVWIGSEEVYKLGEKTRAK